MLITIKVNEPLLSDWIHGWEITVEHSKATVAEKGFTVHKAKCMLYCTQRALNGVRMTIIEVLAFYLCF